MANIYVRSTDGNNSDDGSTWALAKLDGVGATAIDAASDNVYFSHLHAETTAASISWAFAGTTGSPVKAICVNDGAEPPTTVATTATVTTTGGSPITISGSFYMYGITFKVGTAGNNAGISLNNSTGHTQTFEDCTFEIVNTGSNVSVTLSGSSGANNKTILKDSWVKFSAVSHRTASGRGTIEWIGGGITAGSSAITGTLVTNAGGSAASNVTLSGLDLSAGAASMSLFQGDNLGGGRFLIRNSKLPASWSGSLLSGTIVPGNRAEMHNCDSSDTNYRLWVEDYYGSIKSETTLVKTGGASDGTTPVSRKMVSSANTSYPSGLLASPEISRRNSTVGSAITVTVDILHDSLTSLTDGEIWLEVQYLGTTGFPISTFITDAKADILATAANQTSSSATWTTTGMTNPNKQKLSVTFTAQEVGFIQARVMLSKASTTLYYDPVLQVS